MNREFYEQYHQKGGTYVIPVEIFEELLDESEKLKEQLNYLRSGEYYNQLRFENEMLQQVVDTNGVPSEVYDYIECVHRNTKLLEENEKLKAELGLYRGSLHREHEAIHRANDLEDENKELKEQLQQANDTLDTHNELIEHLKKELNELQKPQIFIDTQDMEEQYGEELYQDYLEEQVKELKKQQQEFIKYMEDEIELGVFPKCAYNTILQKYEEIIGNDINVGSKGGKR